MTRRDLLRIGGLGLAGMSLTDLVDWQAASAKETTPRTSSFGRAKSIILIHLYGAPSQIEWVDPKPDAPVEIRGELGCIPSSLPGLRQREKRGQSGWTMPSGTGKRLVRHNSRYSQ